MHSIHPTTLFALIASLLMGTAALTGCAQESSAVEAQQAGVTVNFSVGGMHCEGCAALIRSAISRVDGVQRCAVSYTDETAEVTLAEDDEATVSRIVEAVVEEGFTIERR
jgi:copper chaperone CopZ